MPLILLRHTKMAGDNQINTWRESLKKTEEDEEGTAFPESEPRVLRGAFGAGGCVTPSSGHIYERRG